MTTHDRSQVDPELDALYREAHRDFMRGQRQPAMAVMLSFLVTGAGQFYNGERLRGLLLAAVYIAGAAASIRYAYPVLLWLPFWVWGMFDAHRGARRGNRALLDRLASEVAARKHEH